MRNYNGQRKKPRRKKKKQENAAEFVSLHKEILVGAALLPFPPPGPMVESLFGLKLITISNSFNMPLLASAFSLCIALISLSSFILANLSSLVSTLLGRAGSATASNTSGSLGLGEEFRVGEVSPVSAFSASSAPPPVSFSSPTVVNPLREVAGEYNMLMDEIRFSLRSIPDARAALPSSQACCSILRSWPMDSYCDMRSKPTSEISSASLSAFSDSSRNSASLAWRPRMPVDRELSLRNCVRRFSRLGERGNLVSGMAGKPGFVSYCMFVACNNMG